MPIENNDQSAVGKSYSISYKINNNNGNSTRIIIAFKEFKTPDGKFGVSDIVSSTEDTSSFTCLCPPGKPLYLSNFRAVLAKSTLIKDIRLDNAQSATVKTYDKRTEKEKEVAGFSSEKGNVDDETDLLSENEESNGMNFFDILASRTEKVYLDIAVPSSSKASPDKKGKTTTTAYYYLFIYLFYLIKEWTDQEILAEIGRVGEMRKDDTSEEETKKIKITKT